MPKKTIKELEDELATLRQLRDGDSVTKMNQLQEIIRLRETVETLRADKAWLKQVHSNMLQSLVRQGHI